MFNTRPALTPSADAETADLHRMPASLVTWPFAGRALDQGRGTLADRLAARSFRELDVSNDAANGVLWCRFNYADRPCFTPPLLDDIRGVEQVIAGAAADRAAGAEVEMPKYLVWASNAADAWSLGGDLDLFARLIRTRDSDTLRRYAHKVVEEGFANWTGFGEPIVTVALIQGETLGGGFEAALSSQIIVAERSARFGLPEILFSLFPGMGAYTYLCRRIGPAQAERMILSGRIYTAEELHELGVVDILAEDGRGEEAFYAFVNRNRHKHAAHRAVYAARQRVNPVTIEELKDITDSWVETAMTLRDEDLRKMMRLVEAQNRRRARLRG